MFSDPTQLAILPAGFNPPGRGQIKIKLDVRGYDPDGTLVGHECKDDDLATKQFAQVVMALVFASTQTIADTSASTHSVANNTATSAVTVLAGTTGTAATVLDTALGAQTETGTTTVNAYSGSGSSGTFTITSTVTATADRAYQEVGLRITIGGNLYLLCHDTFSTVNVSNTGTLAVTYTITFS